MNILELMGVALAALLSENFILVTCLGLGTRVRALGDPADALRTGHCLTWVMVLSTLAAWLINYHILERYGWQHFRLMVYALLIPGLVALLRLLLRTFLPELSRRADENLAAVSSNCAALGTALLITQRSYSLGSALLYALCGGVGATVALASFASLREDIRFDRCPRCFRGIPIQLITAGLMAMSLVGFYGLHLH